MTKVRALALAHAVATLPILGGGKSLLTKNGKTAANVRASLSESSIGKVMSKAKGGSAAMRNTVALLRTPASEIAPASAAKQRRDANPASDDMMAAMRQFD